MIKVRRFLYRHPAQVYAYLFAIAAFVSRLYPEIPVEVVVVMLLGFLGLGNKVQSVENAKTLKALYMKPPKQKR